MITNDDSTYSQTVFILSSVFIIVYNIIYEASMYAFYKQLYRNSNFANAERKYKYVEEILKPASMGRGHDNHSA